jgi:hypothetical protein
MRDTRWASLILAALLLAAVRAPLPARENADEPAKGTLPPDLSLVTADAVGFVSFRVADTWNAEDAAGWRKMVKDNPQLAAMVGEIRKNTGLEPADVERVVVIPPAPEAGPGEPLTVVTTVKAFDRTKVLAAVAPKAEEKKVKGKSYWVGPNKREAIHIVNDRTFVVSSAKDLEAFLGRGDAKPAAGEMKEALTRATGKHAVVAALNVPPVAKVMKKEKMPDEMKPLMPLFEAQFATLTIDTGKELTLEGRLSFAGEDAAKTGEKAAEAGADLLRKYVARGVEEIAKAKPKPEEKDLLDKIAQLLKDAEAGLKAAKPKRDGKVLEGTLHVKTAEPATALFLIPVSLFMAVEVKPAEKDR